MQTPPPEPGFLGLSWIDITTRFREIIHFLREFARNPVDRIKRVPAWDWPTLILFEVCGAVVTGFVGGIISRHIISILIGIFFAPFMYLLATFAIAAVIYYGVLFLFKTELEFRRVYTVTILAVFPSQVFGILTPLSVFITPGCIIVTAVLLIVGVVDNFMLNKKKVSQFIGTLAIIGILYWLYGTVLEVTTNRIHVQDYTPETLDQIHKELGDGH